ncbi:MAG: hypothetical protein AAB579_01035 [Patescibacteria group bacterium]
MAEPIGIEEASELIKSAPAYSTLSPNNEYLEIQRKQNELEDAQTRARILATERLKIIEMRSSWSTWLLRVIIGIVVFDFFVIVAVGYGWMTFKSDFIVPFFVGESFFKTIGLAVIVVRYLFNKEGDGKE